MDIMKYFYKGGLNCAETTMRVLIDEGLVDLPVDTVKLMTGFGGGIMKGLVCGCVTGAVAALGSIYGRTDAEQSRQQCMAVIRDFNTAWAERFTDFNCKELNSNYLVENPQPDNAERRPCTIFVEAAVEIVKELAAKYPVAE